MIQRNRLSSLVILLHEQRNRNSSLIAKVHDSITQAKPGERQSRPVRCSCLVILYGHRITDIKQSAYILKTTCRLHLHSYIDQIRRRNSPLLVIRGGDLSPVDVDKTEIIH